MKGIKYTESRLVTQGHVVKINFPIYEIRYICGIHANTHMYQIAYYIVTHSDFALGILHPGILP